jgi:hypothetical protein
MRAWPRAACAVLLLGISSRACAGFVVSSNVLPQAARRAAGAPTQLQSSQLEPCNALVCLLHCLLSALRWCTQQTRRAPPAAGVHGRACVCVHTGPAP